MNKVFMFDLHSHILPGVDDGARDLNEALQMARMWVEQGVLNVVCTPHILPGVYHNSGPQIREAVAALQAALITEGIGLQLLSGADNHIVPTFVRDLQRGHLLTIADTRYVLVEPPHHSAPLRMEDLFHEIQVAGYVPILTHPERLSWTSTKYDVIARLADRGVLMQLTASSITGRFGRRAQELSRRMLKERRAHIVATDAHNIATRPPDMLEAWTQACEWVGREEADNLFVHRPHGILSNLSATELQPFATTFGNRKDLHDETSQASGDSSVNSGIGQRLRRLFG
jgi:protein-tyrosine phosphatase